jgi:hypothetical protein
MALIALYARGGSVHEPVHDHDSERLTSTTERHRIPHEIRLMLGNLVSRTAGSRRAEMDVLRPVTLAANGPANVLGLPMSADTRRDEPGCRPPGDQTLRRSGQLRGPGFTSGPGGAAPRPRLGPVRRPALPGRRRGKSCSSAAGRVRSGAAGTSPPAVSLAEHRVESGVGPDLPDLLRAAAGGGDLGRPPQRLLA